MLSVFMPDIINADYLDFVRQAQATNVSLPAAPSLYWKMSRTSSEAVNSVSLLLL
jgi:hypothetical protein